jgi:hypothetical protein
VELTWCSSSSSRPSLDGSSGPAARPVHRWTPVKLTASSRHSRLCRGLDRRQAVQLTESTGRVPWLSQHSAPFHELWPRARPLTRAADAHASSACRSCAFIITATYTLRSSVSCQGHVLPGAGCARRGPRGLQVALSNQACVSAACGGAVAVDSSSDACRGVFRFPSAWRSLRRLRSLARRGGAAAARGDRPRLPERLKG